jgi:hypothetical protein
MATSDRRGWRYKLLKRELVRCPIYGSGNLLSPQEMVGKAFLYSLSLFVPFSPLMENNINNLVVLSYVLGWRRHKLVDSFTEYLDVASSIVLYASDKFSNSFLVLYSRRG